jgi:hypothetical protein
VTRLIFCELSGQGDSAERRQRQENKARNFEPQLVQNPTEGTQRDSSRLQDRTHGPAVARMPPGHLCEDTEFPS